MIEEIVKKIKQGDQLSQDELHELHFHACEDFKLKEIKRDVNQMFAVIEINKKLYGLDYIEDNMFYENKYNQLYEIKKVNIVKYGYVRKGSNCLIGGVR